MNLRIRRFSVVAAMLPLVLAGCEQPKPAPPPPPEVSTITIQPQRVVLTTELPGRTTGYLVAEIRPQISGLIQKRLFTEGSDVKEGQLLYQIDPAQYQAALDSATATLDAAQKAAGQAKAAVEASIAFVSQQQATLALAQLNRDRYEDLLKEKAVSTLDRDQAATNFDVAQASLKAAEAQVQSARQSQAASEAAIEQARAAVKTAQINLDYTKIVAPISGRIGRSSVTDGAIVTAYQPMALATIQTLDPIYVDVTQSTSELSRLKSRLEDGRLTHDADSRNQVELIVEDGGNYPTKGTLQFRDVSVDPTTGSVVLRMVFPNPDMVLLPGMFVRAIVREGVKEQAILTPQQTVSRDTRGEPQVLVIDDSGKVAQRKIGIDRAIGNQWLVSSGLAAGDRVIIEGMQKVRPGVEVKVVPMHADAPTPGPAPAAKP